MNINYYYYILLLVYFFFFTLRPPFLLQISVLQLRFSSSPFPSKNQNLRRLTPNIDSLRHYNTLKLKQFERDKKKSKYTQTYLYEVYTFLPKKKSLLFNFCCFRRIYTLNYKKKKKQ